MLITFVLTCFILFIFPQQGKTLKEDFLVYYPEAKGNVAMLKEACRKSYHCLGFTTDLMVPLEVVLMLENGKMTHQSHFMLEVCMFIISDLDVCAMK